VVLAAFVWPAGFAIAAFLRGRSRLPVLDSLRRRGVRLALRPRLSHRLGLALDAIRLDGRHLAAGRPILANPRRVVGGLEV
jgi:hypothetical protein